MIYFLCIVKLSFHRIMAGVVFLVFPPFVSFPNLALADLSAFDYHSHPL
jgi:hypothetical protein